MYKKLTLSLFLSIAFSPALASAFTLKSTDITQGKNMSKAHEFTGFGCEGDNLSPSLSWVDAPKGTKAFAIQAYDPDAPTGSGWWHWQIVNISADVMSLSSGSGDMSKKLTPEGSISIKNDYGFVGFGGACPPKGHGKHRYQFTIHALPKKLDLPEDPSNALVGYMINANSIGSSTIESLYERK